MVPCGNERVPVGDASERLSFPLPSRWRPAIVGLVFFVGVPVLAAAPSRAWADWPDADCDGPEADGWVSAFRDRVVSYDGLAQFALTEYGSPVACEGAVTTEFDGVRYGTLVLTLPSGVSLQVETQPLETSIVTLRAAEAFSDPASVEGALRAYTAQIGVSIDWDSPGTTTNGNEVIQTFRDPEPGLNASASMVRTDGALVAVRFSMAL